MAEFKIEENCTGAEKKQSKGSEIFDIGIE